MSLAPMRPVLFLTVAGVWQPCKASCEHFFANAFAVLSRRIFVQIGCGKKFCGIPEIPQCFQKTLRGVFCFSVNPSVKTLRAFSVRRNRKNAGMSTTLHAPQSERWVLTAAEAAEALGISVRHFWGCLASGRLGPQPISLGRSKRWRKDELLAWVAAGAPPRDKWNPANASTSRNGDCPHA